MRQLKSQPISLKFGMGVPEVGRHHNLLGSGGSKHKRSFLHYFFTVFQGILQIFATHRRLPVDLC